MFTYCILTCKSMEHRNYSETPIFTPVEAVKISLDALTIFATTQNRFFIIMRQYFRSTYS